MARSPAPDDPADTAEEKRKEDANAT